MQLWLIHADANAKAFLPNQTLSMAFTGQKEESKDLLRSKKESKGEKRGQGWFLEAEPGY